jgi:thiol:disulfide interchange protein
MTCKVNEAVALNRAEVARWVRDHGVVAIKADKTHNPPEIDQLLMELGNAGRVIPFYAIYPGRGGDPITFGGLITQQQVLDALEQAGGVRR